MSNAAVSAALPTCCFCGQVAHLEVVPEARKFMRHEDDRCCEACLVECELDLEDEADAAITHIPDDRTWDAIDAENECRDEAWDADNDWLDAVKNGEGMPW